jgi:hypothetical protein
MDAPYRVEESRTTGHKVEYVLCSSGNDSRVYGSDLAFLHKIAELLNEDAHTADTGR